MVQELGRSFACIRVYRANQNFPRALFYNEGLDPLHKMPDLRIVGQPERAVRASDDATQVAYVKRAAPVVEVGVGWEGVELERASSGDAPDRHVHRSEPERPVTAAGDPAGRHIVRSVLWIGVKQVQLPFHGDASNEAVDAEPEIAIRPGDKQVDEIGRFA